MTDCRLMETCITDECPVDMNCPYDSYAETEKNRSTARKRHHNAVKAKENLFLCAKILSAKAEQIPASISHTSREKRSEKAFKKCKKFKRQIEQQKREQTPYRK